MEMPQDAFEARLKVSPAAPASAARMERRGSIDEARRGDTAGRAPTVVRRLTLEAASRKPLPLGLTALSRAVRPIRASEEAQEAGKIDEVDLRVRPQVDRHAVGLAEDRLGEETVL